MKGNSLIAMLILLLILQIGLLNCNAQTQRQSRSSTTRLAVGTAPGSVEIVDLDNDGTLDIIVANEQSNNVTILLGSEAGRFTQAKGSPFPAGKMPNDIAIGDYNGDKKLDLAFANHESTYLTILLGDGKGGFNPAANSRIPVQAKPHPHGIAASDFNGDGKLDLVTDSWENDKVEVIFGNGKGEFATDHVMLNVGRHPYQRVRSGDVNNDGKPDLITTNLRGRNVTVLLGDGKRGFKESQGSPFPCNDFPFFLAVRDLNRDGNPDLVVANSPSNTTNSTGADGLTLLFGNGKGGFTKMGSTPFSTGKAPTRLAVGDVNGDGNPDIAVANLNSDTVTLFLLNGKGEIESSSTITVGGQPKGIAIGDLNGDKKEDLVIANNSDNDIMIVFSR